MKNKKTGFTLIELMVTLAVATILLAIAAPSFNGMIQNNRITTESNRLIADMQLARSEAMKRGVQVILCRSNNPTASTPSCTGTANVWTDGWLMFANGDSLDAFDGGVNDILLKVGQMAGGLGLRIRANSVSQTDLIFNPDATTDEGGNTARFSICDARGIAYGKLIEVPPIGRPRIANAIANCNNPS